MLNKQWLPFTAPNSTRAFLPQRTTQLDITNMTIRLRWHVGARFNIHERIRVESVKSGYLSYFEYFLTLSNVHSQNTQAMGKTKSSFHLLSGLRRKVFHSGQRCLCPGSPPFGESSLLPFCSPLVLRSASWGHSVILQGVPQSHASLVALCCSK
jgi:hypothetical protein